LVFGFVVVLFWLYYIYNQYVQKYNITNTQQKLKNKKASTKEQEQERESKRKIQSQPNIAGYTLFRQ
jgi:hypothetical protein